MGRETILYVPGNHLAGNMGRSWRRQLWLGWGSKPQRPSRVPEVAMFDFYYISRSTLGLIDNIGMFFLYLTSWLVPLYTSTCVIGIRHLCLHSHTPRNLDSILSNCS
jgi:hypothetical protein